MLFTNPHIRNTNTTCRLALLKTATRQKNAKLQQVINLSFKLQFFSWTVCLHSFLAFFQIFSKRHWRWVLFVLEQILCQKQNLVQTIFCWNWQVRVLSPQSTSSCCRCALLTSSLAAKICTGDLRKSIYQLYKPASRSTARVLASFPISKLPQNTQCIIYQTDCIQRLMYSKLFTVVPLQLMFQVTKQSLSKLLNRHNSI